MKFFLAWIFLWTIWLNSWFLLEEKSWWLLVIILGLTLFFPKELFWPWQWKKVLMGVVFLLLIIGHGQFSKYSQTILSPSTSANQEKIQGKVVKKLSYFYQLQTKKTTVVYLSKRYYLKNKEKELDLNPGDQIIFCANKSRKIINSNHNFWKKTTPKITMTLNVNKCLPKIKRQKNLSNLIIQYLKKIHPQENQKWINLLLLQNWEPKMIPIKEKMLTTGVFHIFIVSGWHLLIVSKIWFYLAKKAKKKYQKRGWEIIGLGCCWLIVYLTNWKLTALKSCLLLMWIWIKKITNSQHPLIHEQIIYLGFLFLLIKPLIFTEISFQLSFLSSWILLHFTKNSSLDSFGKKIYYLGKKSLLIFLVLLPFLITINSKVNLLSSFYVLFFSLMMIILYPLFILTIWWPWLGKFWKLIFFFQEAVLNLAWQNSLIITFGKWSFFWISSYYLLLTCLKKLEKKGWPKIFLIFLLFISLTIITLENWKQKFYHLHFINVGHGLSILLQGPNKNLNILFDAGIGKKSISESKTIYNYLKRQAVTTLDAVFISHQHTDHYNNLLFLKKRLNIKKIITNKKTIPQHQIQKLKIRNLNNQFLKTAKKENNRGLVLQMKINTHLILLTFDMEINQEKILLARELLLPSKILQVGHHGANNATSEKLLKIVKPKFCIISSQESQWIVTKKLIRHNCQVFNTYFDQNIVLVLDKKITVIKKA